MSLYLHQVLQRFVKHKPCQHQRPSESVTLISEHAVTCSLIFQLGLRPHGNLPHTQCTQCRIQDASFILMLRLAADNAQPWSGDRAGDHAAQKRSRLVGQPRTHARRSHLAEDLTAVRFKLPRCHACSQSQQAKSRDISSRLALSAIS